jgi:hypothetical protein
LGHELTYFFKYWKQKAEGFAQIMRSSVCWSSLSIAYFFSSKPEIIIGNETWLNKKVLSSEVFPSTLFEDVFRNDWDSREGGGVLIAIKKGNTGSIKKKADKKRVQFVPIGM